MAVKPSIVQEYIYTAIRQARVRPQGSHGTFLIGTPAFESVVILSDDPAEALADLYRAIEHLVLDRLAHGGRLPVIDDIDFSDEDSRAYATHHIRETHVLDPGQDWYWTSEWQEREREADVQIESGQVEFFADEDAFDGALEVHTKAS